MRKSRAAYGMPQQTDAKVARMESRSSIDGFHHPCTRRYEPNDDDCHAAGSRLKDPRLALERRNEEKPRGLRHTTTGRQETETLINSVVQKRLTLADVRM